MRNQTLTRTASNSKTVLAVTSAAVQTIVNGYNVSVEKLVEHTDVGKAAEKDSATLKTSLVAETTIATMESKVKGGVDWLFEGAEETVRITEETVKANVKRTFGSKS